MEFKRKSYLGLREKSIGFYQILFFLVTLYATVIVSCLSTINFLNQKPSSIDSGNFIDTYFGIILTALISVLAVYLALIAIIGVMDLRDYYGNGNRRGEKIRISLRKFVLSSPLSIILNLASLGSYLILLLFVYFRTLVAISFALVLATFLLWTSFGIRNGFVREVLEGFIFQYPERNWKKICYILISILSFITFGFSFFSAILFHYASFDLDSDRDFYFINESAYLKITPKGIIKPAIVNITYSNLDVPLGYVYDNHFRGAPAYVKIPGNITTPHPYNSYVKVNYQLKQVLPVYREYISYEFFIPVFGGTRENDVPSVSLNLSIILNQSSEINASPY